VFERRLIRDAARGIAALGLHPPTARLLASARRRAAEAAFENCRERALELAPGLRTGEAAARAALDQLAESGLRAMREQVENDAGRSGLRPGWAASLDAWWRDTHEGEYLDDPSLDPRMRVEILSHLDDMNDLLGSYASFFDRLRPYLGAGARTRVLDLAAGHGGFVLAAAELARAEKLDLELTASDIKREYLELGAERARRAGLSARFELQDALDLSSLGPGQYDVLTCTQSLHHFRPGQIAVMFAEAARVASRAVLFIDGARSARNAAAILGLGLLFFRHRAFTHDALVSFRRFYVPEELELIARLCPAGARARAEWIAPGHCVLELSNCRELAV
jgi:2-polyprenyl-3-methyl-5-hydroxy-6-metoxy-1,4-benzoquinol methylase